MSQRLSNYGWGSGLDTAQALLAIELTKSSSNFERKLSAKQLEIDLILNLWHHDDPEAVPIDSERLTIGNIAMYCLALIAACHDPRFFHGHDLIGKSRKIFEIVCNLFFFFCFSCYMIFINMYLYALQDNSTS